MAVGERHVCSAAVMRVAARVVVSVGGGAVGGGGTVNGFLGMWPRGV